MFRALIAGCAIAAALASSAAAAGSPATLRALSPGSDETATLVADLCPTFSWSSTAPADRFSLEVFEEKENAPDRSPVLAVELPGGARSWTPSAHRCLRAGSRYAWTVERIVQGRRLGRSAASRFRIPDAPSPAELAWARQILRRYLRQPEVEATPAQVEESPATEAVPARGALATQAPVGAAVALDVQGLLEVNELVAAADASYAGDIDAYGAISTPSGAFQTSKIVFQDLGGGIDRFSLHSDALGTATLCRAGTSCETGGAADGRIRLGRLTSLTTIEAGPPGGLSVVPSSTWRGSGGSGYFTVPSITTVKVDDNGSGCSNGVVVGVRLWETDSGQIGVQVRCSQ